MMNELYTYRNGEKVPLEKVPDQFVVRVLPEELPTQGLQKVEQVSSASTRVTVDAETLETHMANSRQTSVAHHAYKMAGSDQNFLITDRVMVTFKQAPSQQELDAFAGAYHLVEFKSYSDREFLFQLTDETGMNPVKLIVALTEANLDNLESVEHDLNHEMKMYQLALPSDPAYQQQWHLHQFQLHPEYDPRSSTRCEEAWHLLDGFGSADVVVGFSDDGCLLTHPDFDGPSKFAGYGYFQQTHLITSDAPSANPSLMYESGANHGTAVGGVIGGEVDAQFTVGAAPGCQLLPIKWESDGPSLFVSDDRMRTLLDYIADKVDVFSNSWGSSPITRWRADIVQCIEHLSQQGGRRGKGIVFLWAAGNENCPIQYQTHLDVPYAVDLIGWDFDGDNQADLWEWVVKSSKVFHDDLSEIPGVLQVAAVASNAQRSHYSNYGPGIDICAPSSNSHTYWRMIVPGLGITTTTGDVQLVRDNFGGTSSATPLVAGIAALVISANPDLSALEVISILKQTASKNLNFEGYARTPPAWYNADTSWDISPIPPFATGEFRDVNSPDGTWSPWFGHGRVDAFLAVLQAMRSNSSSIAVTETHATVATMNGVNQIDPQDLKGAGPVAVRHFNERGWYTYQDLVNAGVDAINTVTGISDQAAQQIYVDAYNMIQQTS